VPENVLHDDLAAIWEHATRELRSILPPSTFELWLGAVRPVGAQGPILYLSAPAATRSWVERRYTSLVEEALRRQACGLERVSWVPEERRPDHPGVAPESGTVEPLPLDPNHTFERFVIGSGNRLAHAAALAVAELPGEAYNPLFLHGPPGLGKTHLLGAIADYLRRRRPELTTHYTTAERFTSEFVGALRKDGPERFKRRYRGLDALLIDDVQVLEGKEQTQAEFVHTFNALHAAGKQIVLSSDRPPEAITRLADRLRDRFAWGLSVELGPPDLRTKTAVLWQITHDAPLGLPEPIVLRQIANLAAGNVRRLEGAMTRVAALASVLDEPVTPTLVNRALGPSDSRRSASPDNAEREQPSVAGIQEAVCSVLGVSRDDLLSANRTARVIRARQLAMYLSRELTSLSLAQIARQFKRDHSTVLHAIRTVSGRLDLDSDTARALHRSRHMLLPSSTGTPSPTDFIHPSGSPPHLPSTSGIRRRL
jgi:chromosomal replication initiator protein